MIISKTPLRVSLGGGGTDIEKFYSQYGGMWISGAIDKYVYVMVKPRFERQIRLSYSGLEEVCDIDQIKHGVFRETLKFFNLTEHIELSTLADLPAQVGLGSSGSFTVGLVNALCKFSGRKLLSIPEFAYHIEHDLLKRPIGKQDPYIAHLGGVKVFEVTKTGFVTHTSIDPESFVVKKLEDSLSLFYTGVQRPAEMILKSQQKNIDYMEQIKHIYELGQISRDAIMSGDMQTYGKIMHEHWLIKRKTSNEMTIPNIDYMYEWATNNGALGGKCVGAGGGGFLMFVSLEKEKFENEFFAKFKITPTPFKFAWEGCKTQEV